MAWSWERILGSRMGPCCRTGGGWGDRDGVVTRVHVLAESEGDDSAVEQKEPYELDRACPGL